MARPVKDGLDYFPLDVDIFDDEILIGISGEFGIKGELTVIKLLCAVYQKGYFVVWSDLMQAKIAKQIQGSKDLANQIVARLVEWEFFDKDLFNSAKVLTSVGIQDRYFEATKRRKQQKQLPYLVNVNNNSVTDDVNVDINTQSKGKESKLNNNNEDEDARANVLDLWQSLWGFPNVVARQDLDEWITRLSPDLVQYAIEVAGHHDVQARAADKYVGKVVQGWLDLKITTLKAAQQANTEHEQRLSNKRGYNRSQQPIQRETLPEWGQDDYDPSQHHAEVSDEQQAAAQARLDKLKYEHEKQGIEG